MASRLSVLAGVVPVDELALVDELVLESDVVALPDVALGGGPCRSPGGGGGKLVDAAVPDPEPFRAEAKASKACVSLSSVVDAEPDPAVAVAPVGSLVEDEVASDVDEEDSAIAGGGPNGGPPCCCEDEPPEFANCARNAASAAPICAALAFVLSTVEVDAVEFDDVADDEPVPDDDDENWLAALLSAACACFKSCRRRLLLAVLETESDTCVLHVSGEPRAGSMKVTRRLRSA